VAEGCLSHGPGDASKAAYNRAEMVDRRRKVIQAWADFLDGKHAANVVPLKRACATLSATSPPATLSATL
jgi:hypothetical protein